MRNFAVAVMVVAVASFAPLSRVVRHGWHASPFSFDKTTHDFGAVAPGESLHASFWLKNTSRRPLRVENIATSCGCVISEQVNREVQPGQACEIPVSVTTRGRSAPADLSASIVVTTRQGNQRRHAQLSIKAALQPPIIARPDCVVLTFKEEEAAYVGNLSLTRGSLDARAFQRISVIPSADLRVAVSEHTSDRLRAKVRVAATDRPLRPPSICCEFEQSSKRQRLELPCECVEAHDVRPIPSSVAFTLGQARAPCSIRLASASGANVEVTDVQVDETLRATGLVCRVDRKRADQVVLRPPRIGDTKPIESAAVTIRFRMADVDAQSGQVQVPVYVLNPPMHLSIEASKGERLADVVAIEAEPFRD